ncbi:MAG: hypothetical protein JOZ99_07515, partial [Actinobacteria bacterium]|nr:hypothetical protein [Actinomycetota bacterium]
AACTRLTIADATALFGEPAVTVTATQRRASTASSSCFYGTSGASGQLLQFRIYSSEGFYARSQHPDAQDVPGLGEQAFLSKAGPGGIVDCQFVKQGNVYALSYSNSTGNAATKADALVALARAVAGRA